MICSVSQGINIAKNTCKGSYFPINEQEKLYKSDFFQRKKFSKASALWRIMLVRDLIGLLMHAFDATFVVPLIGLLMHAFDGTA